MVKDCQVEWVKDCLEIGGSACNIAIKLQQYMKIFRGVVIKAPQNGHPTIGVHSVWMQIYKLKIYTYIYIYRERERYGMYRMRRSYSLYNMYSMYRLVDARAPPGFTQDINNAISRIWLGASL